MTKEQMCGAELISSEKASRYGYLKEHWVLKDGTNFRRTVKEKKTNIIKKQKVKSVRMINEEISVCDEVKCALQKNVKIREENIDEINNQFDHQIDRVINFDRIDIEKLFNLDAFTCNSVFYEEKAKFMLFIEVRDETVALSIFDMIGILYSTDIYKQKLFLLSSITKYSRQDNMFYIDFQDKICKNSEILSRNMRLFEKNFSKVRKVAIFMNKYELNHYNEANKTIQTGDHYFFVSRGTVAEELNIPASSASEILNMLTFLGIINKVSYDDISLEAEIRINKCNNFKNVSLYSIPEYKDGKLILEKLQLMHDNNMSKRDITKKKIEQIFGEDEKDRVFKDCSIKK